MGFKSKNKDSSFDDSSRVLMKNIKKSTDNFKSAKRLTQIARRISNRANFIMRKDLFTGRKPNQSKTDKLIKRGKLKASDKALYYRFPAAIAQRTIQIVGDNWSSFAAAKMDWKKNPEKYTASPCIPKYAKKAKTVYIPCSSFFVRDDYIFFAKSLHLKPISINKGKFSNQPYNPTASIKCITEIRLVPTGSGFRFEIIYKKERTSEFLSSDSYSPLFDKNAFLSIDLGVSRFAALVSNKADLDPLLINGGELKRINQWYNKRCATLRSLKKYKHISAVADKRNRKIKDKLHKISRFIVDLCMEQDIGTVIVGKNKRWKTGINIGKKNNQNFTHLPHAQFINILKYKLREIGINLIEQEESYTSKASYIDNDNIPTYQSSDQNATNSKPVFSGRRVKRGLYKTKSDHLVNADINGAACISRKAGYEGATLVSGGVVTTPVLINL